MIGQTPMTQFQGPNGEWSIFALLITACGGMIAAVLYLFRSREAENKARIDELKQDVAELRHEADKCHQDRLLIHGQMSELKLQMQRLQGT